MASNIYRITFERQISFLGPSIIWMLVSFGIGYFILGWTISLAYALLFIFSLDSLPVLFLHIQYLIRNWHSELTIDRSSNLLEYKKNDFYSKHTLEDVERVIKVSSYNYYRQSFPRYFYYKLCFRNGSTIIITCLLADDLEVLFISNAATSIETQKKTFPSI